MKAPLPEVPPLRGFEKESLHWLSVICALKAVSVILYPSGQLFSASPLIDGAFRAVITGLSLLLVYALWRGSDLARQVWTLVLLFTFAIRFFPRPATSPSHAWTILPVLNVALNAWMLIYLNLPAVKARFDRLGTLK